MKFEKSKLDTLFANLERVEGKAHPDHYAVINDQGSTIAQVVFNREGEMSIEVDNFPAEKKYYSSSIPLQSLDDFISDMHRAGIKLETFRAKSLAALRVNSLQPIPNESSNGVPVEKPLGAGKDDYFYPEATQIVIEMQRVSASFLQRKLRIGYNRAAYIIAAMEADGIVSIAYENGGRMVLKRAD